MLDGCHKKVERHSYDSHDGFTSRNIHPNLALFYFYLNDCHEVSISHEFHAKCHLVLLSHKVVATMQVLFSRMTWDSGMTFVRVSQI